MVGLEQAAAARHDAVAVGVGVVRERHVEAVPQRHHAGHGMDRRGIHADLAVPVERHETESRIDRRVHDLEVQLVALADGGPVRHAGSAERVDAELQPARPDRLEVHDRGEVADVAVEIRMAGGRSERGAP